MNSAESPPFITDLSPACLQGPPQYVSVTGQTAPMHQNIIIRLGSTLPVDALPRVYVESVPVLPARQTSLEMQVTGRMSGTGALFSSTDPGCRSYVITAQRVLIHIHCGNGGQAVKDKTPDVSPDF
ncbi:hypothetical protein DPEC_G00216250 [Dallia pectoralis]|uniref:Uncharacterized protein n=1 Tax=Dallia pectoralis TaxID=75939 RepID=A0ACC2G2X6_DALPE|nr:hypothetical protein DPEC_G00216250 [Dallia pectoralis]